jgi:hypothetical protein
MTMSETQSGEMQQRAAALTPFARTVGLRVFVSGAVMQTLAVYLFAITLLTVGFYRRTHGGSEVWSLEGWKSAMNEQVEFWVAIGVGGLALAVVSMPFGSWAGKMIGIRKRSLGWVGPLAALAPALIAGFVLVVTLVVLRPSLFDSDDDPLWDDFVLPVLIFSLLFYIPGILTSLMAGLAIRQKMKGKTEELEREMALQQQHE